MPHAKPSAVVVDLAASLADMLDGDQIEALKRARSVFTPAEYEDGDAGFAWTWTIIVAASAIGRAPQANGSRIDEALDLAARVTERRVVEARALARAAATASLQRQAVEVVR